MKFLVVGGVALIWTLLLVGMMMQVNPPTFINCTPVSSGHYQGCITTTPSLNPVFQTATAVKTQVVVFVSPTPPSGCLVTSVNGLMIRDYPNGRVVGSLPMSTRVVPSGERVYAGNYWWVSIGVNQWVAAQFLQCGER